MVAQLMEARRHWQVAEINVGQQCFLYSASVFPGSWHSWCISI